MFQDIASWNVWKTDYIFHVGGRHYHLNWERQGRKSFLFLMNAADLLWRQIVLFMRDNGTSWPCISGHGHTFPSSAGSMLQPMQTKDAQNIYDAVWSDVLSGLDPEGVWYASDFYENIKFAEMVQVLQWNSHNAVSKTYQSKLGFYGLFELMRTLPSLSHVPWAERFCPTSCFDVRACPWPHRWRTETRKRSDLHAVAISVPDDLTSSTTQIEEVKIENLR